MSLSLTGSAKLVSLTITLMALAPLRLFTVGIVKMAERSADVLETVSKNQEGSSERGKAVTAAVEARNLIHEAFPPEVYGNKGAAIYEAYRFLSRHVKQKQFTLRRARALYNGEVRRFDAEEKDALLLAQIKEAKNEQQRIRARLAALDEKIAAFGASSAGKEMAADR